MADGKQYSIQDMLRITSDATFGGGLLDNTVFSRPRDAYEYDDIAATAAINHQRVIKKYMSDMAGIYQARRKAGIAAATGLNEAATMAIDGIFSVNPDAAMNIIGHHGGREGMTALLQMSNQMAFARSGRLGSVMNPNQQVDNLRFAAIQGGLAYRNNFNNDGSVNIDQTHGLNLAMTSYISGQLLSDKSQYASWADRMRSKDKSLSKAELAMTDNEIENFKNGVGMTKRTTESFNNQIKKLQEQINGFVSSVSKMTGDSKEAVDFLQRMTDGKLFSAEKGAAESRDRAMKTAFNMRIAAADAGMSSQELYARAKHMKDFGDYSLGFTSRSRFYNQSSATTDIGALMATAFAKWQQVNPMATEEDKIRMQNSLEDRTEGYFNGDMVKMIPLASKLIAEGVVTSADVKRYVSSGNAQGLSDLLAGHVGGKAGVRWYMSNKHQQEIDKLNNRDSVNELNSLALANGYASEQVRIGRQKEFDDLKKEFSYRYASESGTKVGNVRNELLRMQGESMTSDDMLRQAGLDESQIQDIRKTRAFKAAARGRFSLRSIREEVGKRGGNISVLDELVERDMLSKMGDKYGDSAAFKSMSGRYNDLYGTSSVEDKRKRAYARLLVNTRDSGTDKLVGSILSEKDREKKRILMNRYNKIVEQGIAGENGLDYYSDEYIEQLLSDNLITTEGGKELPDEKKKEYIKTAKDILLGAKTAGKPLNEAFDELKKNERVSKWFRGNYSVSARKAAYEKVNETNIIGSVGKAFMKELNVDSDTFKSRIVSLTKAYDSTRKDLPSERRLALALRKEFGQNIGSADSITRTALESMLNDLESGKRNSTLVNAMEDAAIVTQGKVRTSTNAAKAEIEKALNGVDIKDPVAVSKALERLYPGMSGKDLRAQVDQLMAMDLSESATGQLSGRSNGTNEYEAFWQSFQQSKANEAVSGARDLLGNEKNAAAAARSDLESSRRQNRTIGRFGEDAKKYLADSLDVDKKVKEIDKAQKEILNDSYLKGRGIMNEGDLARTLGRFESEKGSLTGDEYENEFSKTFGKDAYDKLSKLSRHRGISFKDAVATMQAGVGKSDEERSRERREAFLNSQLENGGEKTVSDPTVANLLGQIKSTLDTIAKKKNNSLW